MYLRKITHIALFLWTAVLPIEAQKYFVSFSDKYNNSYAIDSPEEFLSLRAIERRRKQNIRINEQDLPVTLSYVDSVKNMGVRVLWPSKWFNGVIVETNMKALMDTISKVSFIKDAKLIDNPDTNLVEQNKFEGTELKVSLYLKSMGEYGVAWDQTQTLNGQYLHSMGWEGQDMEIAVIDNGFNKVDELPLFMHLWEDEQILSWRDFVEPGGNVFEGDGHGTNVLSVMGGYMSEEFKGSAPKAKYHLLRSEDNSSETPVEEYNWVVAAEYADSVGADIIHTSLGYFTFIGDYTDYTNQDMDGETTLVVRGAEIAFSKGMMVVCSAGNEGNSSWGTIISPADGEHILSVAAMDRDSLPASFSSYGPSADGRVKPDVIAVGLGTAVQGIDGDIEFLNGTSFSAPVISGFVACLWQANSDLNNTALLNLVRECAHAYDMPDDLLGYGIPNFKQALGATEDAWENRNQDVTWYPNPFVSFVNIRSSNYKDLKSVSIYDVAGNSVYQQYDITLPMKIEGLQNLPNGIYLIQIKAADAVMTSKIVKK